MKETSKFTKKRYLYLRFNSKANLKQNWTSSNLQYPRSCVTLNYERGGCEALSHNQKKSCWFTAVWLSKLNHFLYLKAFLWSKIMSKISLWHSFDWEYNHKLRKLSKIADLDRLPCLLCLGRQQAFAWSLVPGPGSWSLVLVPGPWFWSLVLAPGHAPYPWSWSHK